MPGCASMFCLTWTAQLRWRGSVWGCGAATGGLQPGLNVVPLNWAKKL